MIKDDRYNLIKPMIESDRVRTFGDIFKYIPKTVVAKDLGMNVSRFSDLIKNLDKFRLEDLFHLAELCGLDPRDLFGLVTNEYELNKSKGEK